MEEVRLGAEGANSRRGLWGRYNWYRVGVRDNRGQVSQGFGVGSGGGWLDGSGVGDSGRFGLRNTSGRAGEGFNRL